MITANKTWTMGKRGSFTLGWGKGGGELDAATSNDSEYLLLIARKVS